MIALAVGELDGRPLRRDVGSHFCGWVADGPVLVWTYVSLLVAGENGKVGVVGESA